MACPSWSRSEKTTWTWLGDLVRVVTPVKLISSKGVWVGVGVGVGVGVIVGVSVCVGVGVMVGVSVGGRGVGVAVGVGVITSAVVVGTAVAAGACGGGGAGTASSSPQPAASASAIRVPKKASQTRIVWQCYYMSGRAGPFSSPRGVTRYFPYWESSGSKGSPNEMVAS